jgi:hypothetical protein
MTDYSINDDFQNVKRVNRVEFFVYFALIYTFAIFFHLIAWPLQALRYGRLPRLSPLARAHHDASAVTPMIFRG